jgi:hypothetical protein
MWCEISLYHSKYDDNYRVLKKCSVPRAHGALSPAQTEGSKPVMSTGDQCQSVSGFKFLACCLISDRL